MTATMTRSVLETRTAGFDAEPSDDGRTLEGYAAVFGHRTRVADRNGDFDETIVPGAFQRSLRKRIPVLQFDHGKDPRVGTVPIGAIRELREDGRGLFVRARLFDNPVVEPVRQAIAEGAIKGMSFRFSVPSGGDQWTRSGGAADHREVRDADVHELGPVVFPAYDGTSVSVRSAGLGCAVRNYGDDAPSAEIMALIGLAPGLTPTQRALDRAAAKGEAERRAVRDVRDEALALARGVVRARREADSAYRSWRAPWRQRGDFDRYLVARREVDSAREQLRELCLYDDALVADLLIKAGLR